MPAQTTAELTARLRTALGDAAVLADEDDRRFFSQDIAGPGVTAGVVARPASVGALCRAVALATEAGHSVLARGGGSSYTAGFVPDRAASVVLDMRGLERIVAVDPANMRVSVEAGCTWQALLAALEPEGLRTPFWGPLSGAVATIGGSLSQHAILWGSARHGVSADSVVGLDVVLADGTLLSTGAGAARQGTPFLRHYGPDLTGLFLGDCGALGVKARATLRLVRQPGAVGTASFGFDSRDAMAKAMAEVARSGFATECFGMDPTLQRQRLKRASLAEGVKALKGVVANEGLLGGLRDAAKVAIAGRGFLDDVSHSMHVGTEAPDDAGVAFALGEIRRIAAEHGGREVPDSVPKLMRGARYVSMTSAIGPEGERWLPVHALLPLSDVADAWAAVTALFHSYAESFRRHGIEVGVLTAVVGQGAFALEPVFYWPAPRTAYYRRVFDEATLAGFRDFPPNPEGEAVVREVRRKLLELFLERGASHLQVGKTYRYREGVGPAAFALLEAVKRAVDPRGLMNPGALGLS
ncbi:MAG: FAD-binding oxidoreductase [Steroidobacteraceae bacterium]|jgi:FAD/FMN-containing dehydrogenase|nr:FAD-binding oxidoreductase [Steroidobacteraceae bacterium]